VRVYVKEGDLGRIRPGMRADVATDSYPNKRYNAWLGYISPTAEFTPKSVETAEVRSSLVYQVRIFVCNPQRELRLGMPATVTIALAQPAATDNEHCPNP
jgi:HlyD family secretion protein